MADLDDIRDGDNFGLQTPATSSNFYLNGMDGADWGTKNRMSRIFNQKSGRTVMLAFDHGFLMGPTSGLERIDLLIASLADHADCLMGTRGMIRSCIPASNQKPICLRTDTGTTILTEMNHNVLISEEEAISMNATAMAAMLAIGDKDTEASTIANFSQLVDIGNTYSIPVMGVTAVGKDMARDARYFGLASRVCAENGASIVKTYYTEGFEKVRLTTQKASRKSLLVAQCQLLSLVVRSSLSLRLSSFATTQSSVALLVSTWDVTSSSPRLLSR